MKNGRKLTNRVEISDDDYTESFDMWKLNNSRYPSSREENYTVKRPKKVLDYRFDLDNIGEYILSSSSSEDTDQIKIQYNRREIERKKKKKQSRQKSSTLRTAKKKKESKENGIQYNSDNEQINNKKTKSHQNQKAQIRHRAPKIREEDDSEEQDQENPQEKKPTKRVIQKQRKTIFIKKNARKKNNKTITLNNQIDLPKIEEMIKEQEDSDSSHIEKENWGRLSNKTIKEIVDTEKIYLNHLRNLVQHYLKPLDELSNEK